MNFITRKSPNYRSKRSTVKIMNELSIGLLVVMLASAYYYTTKVDLSVGLRVIYVTLTAVLVNIAIEVSYGLYKKKSVKDVFVQEFPWVTGLIFALAIPVTTNLYVVGMSTAIGVIFGKVVFGGFGQNVFNPAGVARAIVFSSFSKPVVESVVKMNDVFTSATPAGLMASFNWLPTQTAFESKAFAHLGLKNLLLGNHFGAIGETFALVIIVVGLFLAIRKVIDWRMSLIYITTLFVGAGIVGMTKGLGIWYPLAFVMSGGALYGAVFMITDPVTCPTQKTGRVIFALGAAIITLLIRFKANLPEGVVFSILIMNMLTPVIEDFLNGQQTVMRKRYLLSTFSMIFVAILSVTWISATTKAADPVLELNEPTTLINEDIRRYESEVLSEESVDGNTVYTVAAQGYGLKDAEYENPSYQENIFEITVDSESKIVKIVMTQFGDTEGFGDVVNDELYFDRFIGKDLTNRAEEYDTMSGATKTSYSLLSALDAIAEPVLDLGKSVSLDSENVDKYASEILSKETVDGNDVYEVSAEGYGLKDAEFENPEYKENIFEITVDESSKIVEVVMTQFGDTEGLGDVVNDRAYFEKFVGKDLSNTEEEYDTLSGATKTSYSVMSALNAVANEIGK